MTQQKKLLETFTSCEQLLYLHHLTQYAMESWESYTVGDKLQLFESPTTRFIQTLENMEDEYGPNIAMFMVSYITVTSVGVQERELLDLLSNNNDVMTEVHKFNLAPPEDVLFFPPSILAQAKYSMKEFLTYHSFCGKKVLAWNHSEFYVAAAEKYTLIYPGISEDRVTEEATSFTLMLQEHLANLYLTDDKEQLFSESAKQSAKTEVELLQTPQPVVKENQFKLQRLPTHIKVLIPVEGLQRSKAQLIFNLEWLKTKLSAAPIHHLIREVYEVCALSKDLHNQGIIEDDWEDLDILFEFFQLALPALQQSPDNLNGEILGRLAGFPHASIAGLVERGTS